MHTSNNNFWRRLAARIAHVFSCRRHSSPETERIIAELGTTNEMLEAEQQQLRGKLEVVKTEDSSRLAALEQHGREEESKAQDRFAAQERQLDELMTDRSRVYERLDALETAAAEALSRLEANQRNVTELHGEIELQATELESSRSRTGARLDTIDSQLGELAEKGRLYLQIGRETQSELHKQGVRLGWTTMAVAMAIILATVSGAILIWEAQKNARLMTIMSDSIEQLLATMDRHLNSVHRDTDGASPKASAGGESTGTADATATHGPAGRPGTGMTADE